jgi:hypothetical protein
MNALKANQLPRLALANSLYMGEVPEELAGLTPLEETVIARCRVKAMIYRMEYDGKEPKKLNGVPVGGLPNKQRRLDGNVLIFPQHPEYLSNLLPPPIDDILQYVCIMIIGSEIPDSEWLQRYGTPLYIRANKIRAALAWLKAHNHLYRDVQINEESIASLPPDGVLLPFHIEMLKADEKREAVTSRYDGQPERKDDDSTNEDESANMPFKSIVIADVGNNASARELTAAALKHVRRKKEGFVVLPHDARFANEFDNPALFPSCYPTLFPYGVAGFEESSRNFTVGFHSHVKHLLSLGDERFRVHQSFLFTAFNILQRRDMLRSVHFKTRHSWFQDVAAKLSSISPETIKDVADRMSNEAFYDAPRTEEEKKVMGLMKQVQSVTKMVDGSPSARMCWQNEVRAMVISLGVPAFFITINPSDDSNPIVGFLAGRQNLDIDHLLQEDVMSWKDQSCLVAKNPFAAAKFFNLYMKAFFQEILGFEEPDVHQFDNGTSYMGFVGHARAYYAAVEAQGRGTLHCHLVLWVHGALNPNELRQKLMDALDEDFRRKFMAYAEDCIDNGMPTVPNESLVVPSDNSHPCAVRGVNFDDPAASTKEHRLKDLWNVVDSCQRHDHKPTCYKYQKPGETPECRFMLGENAAVAHSSVDATTGEFTLRKRDGLVNNYNHTAIEAVRNNMDIKMIASGENAKAVCFYITDYITKTQLKTHVAYAALETAMRKLQQRTDDDDSESPRVKAKRLLQRCAYEMLAKQELSAPQVASFLMGYEDHFSSHRFRCLYWTAAENYIDECLPSPECRDLSSSPDAGEPMVDDFVAEAADTQIPDPSTTGDTPATPSVPLNDDVILEVGEDGEIYPRASQLRDYIYRGRILDQVSLWEYVARASKVTIRGKGSQDGVSMSSIEDSEGQWTNANVLTSSLDIRPSCRYLGQHDEYDTAYTVICHPLQPFIPIPIGPAIPRRDRPAVRAKYCRLMLILLKPWRTVQDLRRDFPSWEDAFIEFERSAPPRITHLLTNMQVFHECRDSRDDHFRNRKLLREIPRDFQERDGIHDVEVEGFTHTSEEEEQAMWQHMRDMKHKQAVADRDARVDLYLSIAAQCGIIEAPDMSVFEGSLKGSAGPAHVDVSRTGQTMEGLWRSNYERRKLRWRPSRTEGSIEQVSAHNSTPVDSRDDGIRQPCIIPPQGPPADSDKIMTTLITKWTLNEEQELAFRIIADRATDRNSEQLRMYLGGPAGTGKSRVIDAVKDLFKHTGQENRYLLASYMGIAAKNIQGVTLHSALNLAGISRMARHGEVHQGMIQYWANKDVLVIDEVSMISLQLMDQINEALQLAKESDKPYGGIHIIFAGDFSQLTPVGATTLYKTITTSFLCATETGQRQIRGKLLWYSVDTVVFLVKPKRQEGEGNEVFVELLGRLREGNCTDDDYKVLSGRVLTPEHTALFRPKDSPWRTAPIVVTDNATKDALNEACAIQFAIDHDKELHWYYAIDRRQGEEITNEGLAAELQWIDSGKTKQRLGRVPLCEDMPVLVSQNWDVAGGVVNGTYGRVSSIRYRVNNRRQRVLTSVVIKVADANLSMPFLEDTEVPILADIVDLRFTNKHSKSSKTIRRQQVAIVPAFAMTAHRAQGQTMPYVIADLEGARSVKAAYVMVSRATSLDGLLIYRPFSISKLQRKGVDDDADDDADLGVEMHRLEVLAQTTLSIHGSPSQQKEACIALSAAKRAGQSLAQKPGSGTMGKDQVRFETKHLKKGAASIERLQQIAAHSFARGATSESHNMVGGKRKRPAQTVPTTRKRRAHVSLESGAQ